MGAHSPASGERRNAEFATLRALAESGGRSFSFLGMPLPHVLIIDDEPSIRVALRRWFERQGWMVHEANDGAAALDLLLAAPAIGDNSYSVIISDLRMPGVSGEQLHARLNTQRPELLKRLVFTSGDNVACPPTGSVLCHHPHVLQKPFEFATLKRMIESIAGAM